MSEKINRRDFIKKAARLSAGALVLGTGGAALGKSDPHQSRWQIDPEKCTQCGRCATECVLYPSAVKCVHAFAVCGYCELCSGYFRPGTMTLNTGGENQLCPTSAIKRTFVEDPYYEYVIDEPLCIGCSLCVKGCGAFGNGSLYLQVRHNLCVNCNECAIALVCPSNAFVRVPGKSPYLLKEARGDKGETNG